NDLHLVECERGPKTVPYPTTKRKEFIGTRSFIKETLWIESIGIRPQIRPMMCEVNARRGNNPRWEIVPTDAQRFVEPTPDDWKNGAQPLCLFDRGIEVFKFVHLLR